MGLMCQTFLQSVIVTDPSVFIHEINKKNYLHLNPHRELDRVCVLIMTKAETKEPNKTRAYKSRNTRKKINKNLKEELRNMKDPSADPLFIYQCPLDPVPGLN
ncbi:hypothetical protein AMECASPLE_025243 [Ameca splendens]|uniref:Uncharacterized protein n=1 Tax=Ameca splendens TaxID=208324 RepID=A0ABV1AC18_9TELE